MFGTKHPKTDRLQKNIEYQTNEIQIIEYKIFELKCGHTKLLGSVKYNQVKLVLAGFASPYLY